MKCLSLSTFFFTTILASFAKAEFIYSCNTEKTIALTFDDGPLTNTHKLVDYFIEQDVKITFFHVARFHRPYAVDVKEFQDTIKKAHDHGFQIASHTFAHKISDDMDEFKKSLDDMDDFIENITGDRPRYFRAPKGHCDSTCQEHLKKWDYNLIQWDTDTNDWDYEKSGSIEQRVEDSINFLKKEFAEERDSYLILMHDSLNHTIEKIAPWIMEKSGMKEKGYRFVTVAECLGDKNGMYRSGKTYGDEKKPFKNDTNIMIDDANNSIVVEKSNDDIKKNKGNLASSDAFINSSPIHCIYYIVLGLISMVFYMSL